MYRIGIAPHNRRDDPHLFGLGHGDKRGPRFVGYPRPIGYGAVVLDHVDKGIYFFELVYMRERVPRRRSLLPIREPAGVLERPCAAAASARGGARERRLRARPVDA